MKYLTVDGMFSGTGIRDTFNSGYLDADDLGLSTELKERLSQWLKNYEDAHHSCYEDEAIINSLDSQGLEICKRLSKEVPDAKIEYYSDATGKKILI